jgi:hypothetical protein
MGPSELSFRSLERARTVAEKVEAAICPRRWKLERLRSRLSRSLAANLEMQQALHDRDWHSAGEQLRRHFATRKALFPLDPRRRLAITESIRGQFPRATEEARGLGDRLLQGRRDLLGYRNVFIGSSGQIDWHFDPVHGRRAPRQFWASIPYLDPRVGDHKIIWELNRHQHWLMLGRAAWLTGDHRYGERVRQELASWLRDNPPLVGINWSSMLELGFRALSWIWSVHFLVALEPESSDESMDSTWLLDLLLGLDAQLNHITRHLSTYFSPNTHLLGEGLALYTAGRVLPELKSARRWEMIGRRILRNEAHRQVCPDGGHVERSAHYHRYALDFYLLALTIGRLTDDPDVDVFSDVTSRMATFCRALASDDGQLPTIGDDDGGSVFPICDRKPADATDSLSLAAALLDRPELAVAQAPEETLWMLGGDRSQLRGPVLSQNPESRLFADTGYAVLRSPTSHAILDVGPHGFLNGGHAHADALSLVLSLEGRPLLVDPGTSTYTMDAQRRDLFRSTFMHNTLTVDGRQQSTPDSPFHWQASANATPRLWRTGRGFDAIEGEHDGYLPHLHRRAVLRDASGLWLIADHFLGRGNHRLSVRWHFDSAWRLIQSDSHAAAVRHVDGGDAGIASTGSKLTHGEGGAFGWRAPVYGQHAPGLTIEVTETGSGPLSVVTVLAAGSSAKGLSVEPIHVLTDRPDARQRVAVQGHYGAGTFIAIFSTEIAGAAELDARTSQLVDAGGNRFHTDARIAVLCLSPDFEPTSLTLIDGTLAGWTGPQSFHLDPLTSAAGLHLDRSTLARLGHGGPRAWSAVDTTERTICAE